MSGSFFFFALLCVCSFITRIHGMGLQANRDGTCGDGLTWSISGDALTISGTGDMDNYDGMNGAPWSNERFNFHAIIVEEGVTSIGEYAFASFMGQNVSLPATLTSIKSYAFYASYYLKKLTIPAGVESIEIFAFLQCSSLATLEVDEKNSYYKSVDGVVYDHDLTTILHFPRGKPGSHYSVISGVTSIGNGAFAESYSLTSISLPDSLLRIGEYAFKQSALTSIILPDKVELIENYAFTGSNLVNITFGSGVKSIGDFAFSSCWNLPTVTIPASVKTLGIAPFQCCNGLSSIEVAYGNTNFASLYGVLFNSNYTQLIQYPSGYDSTSYTIPSCVTSIFDYAFSLSSKLTNVNMLDGLKSIGNHCFEDCSELLTVTISNSVESIGESAFSRCNSLKSVTIPGSVRSVGKNAFSSCRKLANVIISDGVRFIGESAFFHCTAMSSVSISSSVESIGDGAFYYCYHLSSIEVASGNKHYASDDGVLYDHEHTTLIHYPVEDTRENYTIPFGVKTIERAAFYYGHHLVNVSIPSSVISIGDEAFSECTNLIHVNIPNGVVSIPLRAFARCGLTSIIIPNSVVSIGVAAFSSTNLNSVTIPNSVKTIGGAAFKQCGSLEIVNLPDSVESVGSEAFSFCQKLKSVFYQGSIDFPSDAFLACTFLDTLCVSPDYKNPRFSGYNVTSSPICQDFQSKFNRCFGAAYIDGVLVQEKRSNATLFESRTSDCVECKCNNESGAVWWSTCKSSDEVTRMCIDDKCVENPTKDDEPSVVIDVAEVKPSDFSASEVKASVSSLTGIEEAALSVGIEVDDDGYIIRVFVYVKDETIAVRIANAVESLNKSKDCAYGLLCRAKSIHINNGKQLSTATQFKIMKGFALWLVMVCIISMK